MYVRIYMYIKSTYHPCGDPHYCRVYHETDTAFMPLGTNTEMGLHLKPIPTDRGSGSGSS